MCGIAGVLGFDGAVPDPDLLRRMGRVLAHRGPDGFGIWRCGAVGLVHRRLAIQDLSEAGSQPMADPSGRVVVTYNGEIYNASELRSELTRDYGVRFRSTGDTEVLPHAYLAWGETMVDRLEGMFAFALWDRISERLLLARDGIGVKPLWITRHHGCLVFGSEPKALFAAGVSSASLDPAALHTYLASGQPGPTASIFAGLEQLAPGSWIAIDRTGAEKVRTFWAPRRRGGITDGAASF